MNVEESLPPKTKPMPRLISSIRIMVGSFMICCLLLLGLIWVLNYKNVVSGDWTTILLIVFTVLGVVFALCQWLFPVSTENRGLAPLSSPLKSEPSAILQISLPSSLQTSINSKKQFQSIEEPDSSIWNVPYRRNPFFIGREQLIQQIHDKFAMNQTATSIRTQALSGLGGIGKTQIAVEYAYRYRNEYDAILWIRAATHDTLISDFVTLAELLNIPEKSEQNQNKVVVAVKRWLATHSKYLVILDNVDNILMLDDFLPVETKGDILITTRSRVAGTTADVIEVDKMNEQEGSLLLLRRAKIVEKDTYSNNMTREAEAIAKELDGLPLALEQAGAYLEETQCGIQTYLDLYHSHQKDLLNRQSRLNTSYSESVATTWSLSFQQIDKENPAAAELLHFCSFLDADTIPEEIITLGASELGPTLQSVVLDSFKLGEMIEKLLQYSLIRRNPTTKTIIIHCLVQIVLKENMDKIAQTIWAERTIRAVNKSFPEKVDVTTWHQCKRVLSQAQVCFSLIEQYELMLPEAAQLLKRVAVYLTSHALYTEANLFYNEH